MKTFMDLDFKPHIANIPAEMIPVMIEKGIDPNSDILKPGKQAVIIFDNGIRLSVIFGPMFYSNNRDTYEAMASDEDEPRGYLTINELNDYMEEVQLREPIKTKETT